MDPNTAMEAATEGAKALTKFQEIVQKIFGPKWTRKQADADAYADERKLKTIRDNPDMEIVYIAGEMHARERTPEILAQRAEQRMLTEGIRQEENIEKVLEIAAQELQQDDDVSDEAVDEDWIARLFNIVKDINNKGMQYVWGKILAGEIKQPGSFSLRTLDAIRNISQKEAEIFQKISPYILREGDKYFLLSDPKILEKYDIKYAEIMKLDECGLVNSGAHISLNLTISDSKDAEIFNTDKMLYIEGLSTNITKISFGDFALTSTGIELYSVISVSPDENIVFDVAKLIEKKNPQNIKMSIYKVNSIEGQTITYKSLPLREYMFKGK